MYRISRRRMTTRALVQRASRDAQLIMDGCEPCDSDEDYDPNNLLCLDCVPLCQCGVDTPSWLYDQGPDVDIDGYDADLAFEAFLDVAHGYTIGVMLPLSETLLLL